MAMSKAAKRSEEVASALMTGPLEMTVTSTRSAVSAWRGLRSWVTSTSTRWTRGSNCSTLVAFSST